jgi:hypothetical protein
MVSEFGYRKDMVTAREVLLIIAIQ